MSEGLQVRYSRDYPEGLLRKRIIIVASVKPDPYRFIVDLCAGNDIAFHFNPRFDQNKIVVNSKIDEKWGTEMIEKSFPFARGQKFTIEIEVKLQYFKVTVDGNDLLTFNQRVMNPDAIKHIDIKGDVTVPNVDVVDA